MQTTVAFLPRKSIVVNKIKKYEQLGLPISIVSTYEEIRDVKHLGLFTRDAWHYFFV